MENIDSQNKKLILVVDDEEINRELLGNILNEKYKVEYACDGEEAMQCIRRDRSMLSCILLDLNMPKKSGLEVLTEIRSDDALSHIPVMILTAHQEAEIESLESGAYDFIVKPFEMPRLILARVAKTILHAEETYIIRETEKDKLTDLPNLMFFTKLCELERMNLKKMGSKAAYAFFNILNMKAYNTHYSFAEGDKLLYRVGQMLQTCFTDMPVCRLSDDHFAVMGDATEFPKMIPTFLEKIKSTGRGKVIDFQVGVFIEQDEPVDPSSAIDYAHLACNHIRGDMSKHISVFDNTVLKQFEDKQHVLEFFDQALREHWVKVFYQPIVRAITGEICNFEALARWQDPRKGMLNPGVFIPVIEDYKLSARMDLYMVEEVCREAEERKAKGIKQVPISVNFSRNDFDQCDMVDEISKITNKYNYPHELLVIEVTESAFSSNHDYLQEQIDRFHKAGFKVWMDDFGDGLLHLMFYKSITLTSSSLIWALCESSILKVRTDRLLQTSSAWHSILEFTHSAKVLKTVSSWNSFRMWAAKKFRATTTENQCLHKISLLKHEPAKCQELKEVKMQNSLKTAGASGLQKTCSTKYQVQFLFTRLRATKTFFMFQKRFLNFLNAIQ